MSTVQKTLQMTSLLFGMTILFCFIAWSLGYEGFIIVGNIELPKRLYDLIAQILLCINWSFIGSFVLVIYSWKILYFSIPIVLLSAIGYRFFPAIIFTGPLPILILLIIILCNRKKYIEYFIIPKIKLRINWVYIRLFGINIIIIVYQWLVSKFSVIDLTIHVSIYQALRLSINQILLMLLFYSIGGVKYHGSRLECLVFPGRTGYDRSRNDVCQSNPQSAESVPVDRFEKLVMRSVIGVVQVIQWMFILWVCSLDNLFLDALVMTTSFICHGMIIMKRKHLKPIILCTLAATAMFYFAARFTISFQYSQFFPIFIGLLLVYTMYRISYQFDMAAKKKSEEDLKRIETLEKQMVQAWNSLDELS